jgi:hypothetical protein
MSDVQPESHMPGRFPTTQWGRVVTAGSLDAPEAREALSGLCQSYWYAIYAYIRHGGWQCDERIALDPRSRVLRSDTPTRFWGLPMALRWPGQL